jgi:Na+/phosphate symporter
MILILTPLLVLIIGLLMYALCVNPKLQEIGRIMFFCGLFVLLFQGGYAKL